MDVILTPIQAIESLVEYKMKYFRNHPEDTYVVCFDHDLKALRRFLIEEYLLFPDMDILAEEYYDAFHIRDGSIVVRIVDYFEQGKVLSIFPIKPEGKQVKITKRQLNPTSKKPPKLRVLWGGKPKLKCNKPKLF